MTNLGDFFRDLSKNVHHAEMGKPPIVGEEEHKLLQGAHPLRMLELQYDADNTNNRDKSLAFADRTAEFLQAIRSYRPSQKIRYLVSMNPHGYGHGSQFIDPNYMWVGLGK